MRPVIPEPAASGTQNTYAIAALRIAVGLLFLVFGQYKVLDTQFTLHGGFEFWINGFLAHGAYPFMAKILRGFVLPHATPIAFLVAYGEVAIGLALTLGVFVRLASGAGVIYMLALVFSSNYPDPSNYPSSRIAFWEYFGASVDHTVLGLCFAAFLIGRADAVWCLRNSRPKSSKDTKLSH